MRKLCYLYGAVLLAVYSCTYDPVDTSVNEHHQFSINATIDDLQESQPTKASGASVIRLTWTKGDAVSVVNLTTGKALGGNLTAVSDGTSSIFSGDLTGTINANDKLAFVFPSQNYTSEADYEPIEIDYSVQNSTTPSLVMIAPYTVGISTNSFNNINVVFSFQMSFMRLNLSQLPVSTTVSSVQINGVNDHVTLSISNGSMVSSYSAVNNYIKYNKAITTDKRGAQSILVGILPSSATTSRTVSAKTASNTYSAYFGSGKLDVNKYYYSSITGFVKSYMTFKDASVKAKCIELYDADGDGQISFLEAAAVSDLGVALTKSAGDNPFASSILHFAELQFFTGLTTIPSFQGYTMLKTVAIPPQISAIPANSFNGCTALESVIFTSATPPTIGTDAFKNCDTNIAYYVPTTSVETYKTALPSIASSIHDIAEVGTDFGLDGWSDGGTIGGSVN